MARKAKILYLTLKKQWFDLIAGKIKKEEYRELKEFWIRRLFEQTTEADAKFVDKNGVCYKPKEFDFIVFVHGYRKNAPRVKVRFSEINTGQSCRTDWGAEPGKTYIIIGFDF